MMRKILAVIVIAVTLLVVISFEFKPAGLSDNADNINVFENYCGSFYKQLNDTQLNYSCFKIALAGYQKLIRSESDIRSTYFTIIDYSKPSINERLFIIDMKKRCIKLKSLVSHGKNSGLEVATFFSNDIHSFKSSLGFYLTGETYTGRHGYSLRLEGLEPEFNSNAHKRAIVIHPAGYVSKGFIKEYGRIGRSYGCPAVPPEVNASIIDLIKGGTGLFVYYPDSAYFAVSKFFRDMI